MDSLTRWAMAGREVGLAIGEPPTSRGYTPSVFAMMPRFLERAGRSAVGSITALVTVLVEGDDLNEPIADHARSILDGHIVLSRALTERGHLPPVDVLASLSRVMPEIVSAEHWRAAQTVRTLLAALRDNEALLRLGAYRQGTEPVLDVAINLRDDLTALLRQDRDERADYADTVARLCHIADRVALRDA
jgi:FliI/YscN family ATPase